MRRISLATLLVIVAILAGVSAWIAGIYRQHQQTAQDIRELRRVGSVYDYGNDAPSILTDWFPRLVVNEQTGETYTRNLYSVRNYSREKGHKKVETFVEIVARHPEIRSITFDGGKINNQQAATMLALPLESLMIGETPIGDTLRAPASETLTWLSLHRTRINDHSLKAFGPLPNVEYLDLTRTRVSDASINHLATLPRLKKVVLRRCKVTKEGAARLRKMRPDLEVAWEELKYL